MLLVTGGFAGSYFLDSTEVFDPSVGSWATKAKLPQPLEGLRATNINDRVLIFGIVGIIFLAPTGVRMSVH